jgi:hypothetical protein
MLTNSLQAVKSRTEEFMTIVALIQTPGRLLFDPQAATLEKIQP